jgi:hypothetical protein
VLLLILNLLRVVVKDANLPKEVVNPQERDVNHPKRVANLAKMDVEEKVLAVARNKRIKYKNYIIPTCNLYSFK